MCWPLPQPLPPQTTDSRSLQILLQQQQLVQQQMQQMQGMQGMFLFQAGGQSNIQASAAYLRHRYRQYSNLKQTNKILL